MTVWYLHNEEYIFLLSTRQTTNITASKYTIALFLVKKDEKLYAKNPELYSNFSQVKTAKIIAIIGLVLSVIIVAVYLYLISTGQYDAMLEQYMETLEEMQQQQQ